MILSALTQYAGLQLQGIFLYFIAGGDSLPVLAIVMTSHGNSKWDCFQ